VTQTTQRISLSVDADGIGRRAEQSWRQAARRDVTWQIVLPFVVIVPILVGWEIYARRLNNPFVPGPTDVLAAIPSVLTLDVLGAFVATNIAMLQGYLVAVVAGIALGFVMGRFRRADAVASPYLDLAMVTPMIVLMPVVLMAFGLTREALAIVVFLFALPYVAVPVRAGVRAIPTELVDMATSFGARERQLWREIVLPGASPYVLTGLRLGFGQAITGIIATELTLLAVGIGKVILGYQARFQVDSTFAVTLFIVLECVFVMGGLRLLEMRQRNRYAS
jgi:ABC-type nitrate/sulfonate/bicarbonate transport system permease component